MIVKRVIPDKKSNLIHAHEAEVARCIFYDETSGVVGVANKIPNGYYIQWANNTSSPTHKTFNDLVEYVGTVPGRIIVTQIEGY